jgi:hypothetical protein
MKRKIRFIGIMIAAMVITYQVSATEIVRFCFDSGGTPAFRCYGGVCSIFAVGQLCTGSVEIELPPAED